MVALFINNNSTAGWFGHFENVPCPHSLSFFSIYFNSKKYIYLLCNSLSKLATHVVSGDKFKKKIVTRYKVNRHVICWATDLCSVAQNNFLAKVLPN